MYSCPWLAVGAYGICPHSTRLIRDATCGPTRKNAKSFFKYTSRVELGICYMPLQNSMGMSTCPCHPDSPASLYTPHHDLDVPHSRRADGQLRRRAALRSPPAG